MYRSILLIDIGNNPDRPRPGRLWLRNLYHVHQRLCMAFPSKCRKDEDPMFLMPYKQEDFSNGQVHVARGQDAGFLFRIDPLLNGRVIILVQSAVEPDWNFAFQNADYLLAAKPEVRIIDSRIEDGQRLRFCLVANPTRKIDTKTGPNGVRRNGKRVPVRDEQLFDWLQRRGEVGGFSFEDGSITVQTGYAYVNNRQEGKEYKIRSVRYSGELLVTQSNDFQRTLLTGIGNSKAFGFGLLSVAPIETV